MIKKFVKLIIRQPPFLIRASIIFALLVIIAIELAIGSSQSPELKAVKAQAAFVRTIPEMEKKINVVNAPVVVAITESIALQGTFVQGGAFAALINGQIYKEGDNCGEYKVLKIDRGSVVLEHRSSKGLKNLQLPSK